MSWLARSIANSLLSPDDPDSECPRPSASASPGSPPRGVREDLSELTDALAHRFHGLASFLAAPSTGVSGGAPRAPNPAEIAGRFRAGLARLPGRQAVADLAKIASSLLPPDEEWGGAEAAGVTEDVVAFARDAAMRSELWLDFPLLPDDDDHDDDADDFDMTDAQQDHALAVESVAPELADLRIELCPSHMSEGCFWKIYFVLLHPKLRKEDAELLSTPQILEARQKLSQNLQYQTKLENQDTVATPFSNVDGTVPNPVEVVGVLKNQDSARATSFSNVDYGIPQPINLEALSKVTVDAAGAASSDNIGSSSSVPVQLVPVLEDATDFSRSRVEESTRDFSAEDATEFSQSKMEETTHDTPTDDTVANEQPVTLVGSSPPQEEWEQPTIDLSEQSRVVIQKADNDDSDDDGDEWLEEETGHPGSTHIPIAHDDEDISFSDLEEDDGAT